MASLEKVVSFLRPKVTTVTHSLKTFLKILLQHHPILLRFEAVLMLE
ncbi:10344_t:CDS:2 [Funneliformis mosseae]|uniref:10344_t:CDS:1 n=1 Tax=Funneliformis mosseae TaxID=27381 RepID=A0A9N8VQI7_FUNMO|nr:10344_t:CDS:2 [Funneliformis mosseae]